MQCIQETGTQGQYDSEEIPLAQVYPDSGPKVCIHICICAHHPATWHSVNFKVAKSTEGENLANLVFVHAIFIREMLCVCGGVYSGTSDKGPSEIGTTSLQRTLVATPC